MRIDPALKAKLVRVAREQNRSMANLVATILRDHLGDKS
jgi:predicted HicB family RNase H-like nuclease